LINLKEILFNAYLRCAWSNLSRSCLAVLYKLSTSSTICNVWSCVFLSLSPNYWKQKARVSDS